jgi:4-hydroxy-3-methylbut-2-enyl diphosphate reductase
MELRHTDRAKVNLRTPDVMSHVQARVESHYRSELVETIRAQGGIFRSGQTTIRLAKQFGFCYGVERAIDLAYAACKVFSERRCPRSGSVSCPRGRLLRICLSSGRMML